MTLDYHSMPFEDFPNFKGGEKKMRAQMYFDGRVRILHGILEPGASIGEHLHETNAEIMFILGGEGTMIDDGVPSPVRIIAYVKIEILDVGTSEILIFGSFGLSLIYLVNYNIVLVGSILRKVKRIYGGERD